MFAEYRLYTDRMALANGTIPTSQLVVLSVLSKTLGPQYAPLAVARAFEAANRAFKAEFGKELEPVEAYRWLARQWHLWNGWIKRLPGFNLAAYPGTSKHGSSGAIDFGSRVNIMGSREHLWMVENGPRWGFIWTGKNFRPREPWHFDHNGLIVAALNVTPVSTDAPLPKKRKTMNNAYIQHEGQKAVYTFDRTRAGSPLRHIPFGEYLSAEVDGSEVAVLKAVDFNDLLRARGQIMLDDKGRTIPFANKPNPNPKPELNDHDLLEWDGLAVSRTKG